MKSKALLVPLFLAGLAGAGCAFGAIRVGPGDTPFWVAGDAQQQIDMQVARLVADHAAIVVVRTPGETSVATASSFLAKLKKAAPHTPVLMYTWVSRNITGTPGSTGILDWMDQAGGAMYIQRPNGRTIEGFGDVTRAEYRTRLASQIAAAVNRQGYDGVAVDLAVRTPRYRPPPLSRMCSMVPGYCDRYAAGMDAAFDAVRAALDGKALVYNGIWNFGPGSVADQRVLLDHADVATIEFFGGERKNPANRYSFSQDVLPYLEVISKTPADKQTMVFGRGSWQYENYADDYASQRYLYCAYLLAAGTNTHFRYSTTAQLDTPAGRSGGLSVYQDWYEPVGAPSKGYVVESGIYSREFAHGIVLVAPDDGHGGSHDLARTMYSPEGVAYQGHVTLSPGQGLLLLDAKPAADHDQHLLDLGLLADWSNAKLSGTPNAPEIALFEGGSAGGHDMMLDPVRSLHPRNRLQIAAQADDAGARMQLVAEVDDPSHQHVYAVLDVAAQGNAGSSLSMGFRMPNGRGASMPVVAGPRLTPGTSQVLDLDGHALFAGSGFVFRRWDYVRFVGGMKLKSVKLVD
ncbi:MAG TPA: putative glycoside hydrolase [Xanthomonadaceae bacterium]|jgi:hypothetical protein|nr:putative glycoside hydrolase [Xanthomonadaceae bacterium]